MLGDARDDGTSPQSVVYFELKEFIGFGYFLALQNFSHANVELGEVVELDRRGDRFGYVVGFFVGLMVSWNVLKPLLIPVGIITFVSFVAVAVATGKTAQWMIKKDEGKDHE